MIYLEYDDDIIEKYDNALKIFKYTGKMPILIKDEEIECIFCLENIRGNGLCHLKCKHIFHGYCFLKYIGYCKNGVYCPMCRDKVSSERIDDIYDYYYQNILNQIDRINSEINTRRNKIFMMNVRRLFRMKKIEYKEEFMMMELDILNQEKVFFKSELRKINSYFFAYLNRSGIICNNII